MDRRDFIQNLSGGFAALVLGRNEIVRPEPKDILNTMPYYEKAITYGNIFKEHHTTGLDCRKFKLALETDAGNLIFNTVENIEHFSNENGGALTFYGGQIEFNQQTSITGYSLLDRNRNILFHSKPYCPRMIHPKDLITLTIKISLFY